MGEKAVLHPGEARGEIALEIHGALAGLLHLGQASDSTDVELRVMMVAGARNQRYLQISEGRLPRLR